MRPAHDPKVATRHSNHKKGDSWEAQELFTLLNKFEAAVKRGAAPLAAFLA